MQIYFDECGDFDPVDVGTEKFCAVVGLIVPEISRDALKADFDLFVSSLSKEAFVSEEPKGSLLSLHERELLLSLLTRHRDVLIVPVSVNLGYSGRDFLLSAPAQIRSLMESNLQLESPYMPMDRRAELAKRFGNLSGQVLARIQSYAIAVLKSIEAVASRYYCGRFHTCYDPITIAFDRVTTPDSREELVFRDALPGWITNWSRSVPLKTSANFDQSHPLFALYGDKASGQLVLDIKRMLDGKIEFVDSKDVWQIRLADFLASTWSRTIGDYSGSLGFRTLFRDLYRKNALPNETPLGLVSLTDKTSRADSPQYLEIFPRMIAHDTKILPCE